MNTGKIKTLLKVSTLLFIVGGIGACSSSQKTPDEATVDQKGYVVREKYPLETPTWVADFSRFKMQNEGRGNSYFLGDSGEVSDRIAGCDLATISAKKRIAQQISEFISGKIAVSKVGQLVVDRDDTDSTRLGNHFEDTLAGKSVALLTGVKEYGQYWEERDYSMSGGKRRLYQCRTVVVIDDKSLSEAVKRAATQAAESVDDRDARLAAKEALKNVDGEFGDYLKKGISYISENND